MRRHIFRKLNVRRHVFLTIVVLGIFVAAGFFIVEYMSAKQQSHTPIQSNDIADVSMGKEYGHAKIGGHFELIDHHGMPKTDADFKGKYLLVYFGYSFCPDICPAALINITQALNTLDSKMLSHLQPLFITIDPTRDTVKALNIYMQNFHPSFIALTGTQAQINQAMKAYRVYAKKAKPDGTSTEYLMDHSSIVYVMDRQGRYVTSFNHTTDPEKISKIIKDILQ